MVMEGGGADGGGGGGGGCFMIVVNFFTRPEPESLLRIGTVKQVVGHTHLEWLPYTSRNWCTNFGRKM